MSVRAHVLSIRDDAADEKLLESIWRMDTEIELTHVVCGADALTYLQKELRKLPNLIVLAWRFNESQMTATETLQALKADALLRPVPVIVLAGRLSPVNIRDLYGVGVSCVFEMPPKLDALEAVLLDVKRLWLNKARLPYEQQQTYTGAPPVTERERDVIRLIAQDLSAKEIANKLGISPRTVEFHIQRIKDRTGVTGKAGIVRYALSVGILAK